MMDDLISRQAAIDAFKPYVEYAKYDSNRTNAEWVQRIEMVLRYLPSAQPEYKMDEWCTDCREYDQERHCCPRFNKVIRETVEEYKAEHPEPCDDPRADVYYLAEKIGIHQLYALVVELRGEPAQPEITDEQAIEHLQASGWMQNHDKQMCEMGLRERLYDALFPSAQPEPCEDAVSRKAAIDALDVGAELLRRVLDDADIVGAERKKYEWGLGLIESCISDIKELPSAQPERKRGRLEYVDYGGFGNWHCTACRRIIICNGDYDFCPYCGADLREGVE